MSNAMWGGRFQAAPDALMEEINASIDFDKRLWAQDIRGSLAHLAMLEAQGIVGTADAKAISEGLEAVPGGIGGGPFTFFRARRGIPIDGAARPPAPAAP